MRTIGIITGSGIYGFDKHTKKKKLNGVDYFVEYNGGKKIIIVPRHGINHQRLAAEVPHEKNFSVFTKEKNLEGILAISSVGCLDENIPITKGVFVVPHDYLRGFSSAINFLNLKTHPDMSEPFDKNLKEKAIEAIKKNGYRACEEGIYVGSGGNCFETKAEIAFLNAVARSSFQFPGSRHLSAKGLVVGLTAVPEIILAKEYNIPYALICVPVNYGTGMAENPTHEQTLKMMKENKECIEKIIFSFLRLL